MLTRMQQEMQDLKKDCKGYAPAAFLPPTPGLLPVRQRRPIRHDKQTGRCVLRSVPPRCICSMPAAEESVEEMRRITFCLRFDFSLRSGVSEAVRASLKLDPGSTS